LFAQLLSMLCNALDCAPHLAQWKNVSDSGAREIHLAGSVLDKVLARAPQVHLFQRRNRARLARRAGWKAFAAALLSTFIVRLAG
jgi:hypothetical protein